MVLASRSNRCLRTGSEEKCAGRTLMATVRSSRVSRARYTSPIPPAPNGATISYGPSRVLRLSGISGPIINPGNGPGVQPLIGRKRVSTKTAAVDASIRPAARQLPNCGHPEVSLRPQMFWRDRILHHESSRVGALNNHHEQDLRLADANQGVARVSQRQQHCYSEFVMKDAKGKPGGCGNHAGSAKSPTAHPKRCALAVYSRARFLEA